MTLFQSDGATQVDTYDWAGGHAATTYGRCPDGTGDFVVTTASTRGLANACSPVRINEIESEGDTTRLDRARQHLCRTGRRLGLDAQGHRRHCTLTFFRRTPSSRSGATWPSTSSFGLGRCGLGPPVRRHGGAVESYTWGAHAAVSYGRCKDGLGDFVDNVTSTKGAANDCPGLDTSPWPGSQEVSTADLAETFNADASGLAFDPADPNMLWVAQNKRGTLWKLTGDGTTFTPAAGWETGKDPKYLDGTGAPDTEGLTIGGDGFIYAASERNNDASGVSRMSILRYDPAATTPTLVATDEWDVTAQIQALSPAPIGANLGLEGITFVPDSFLVAKGFKDVALNKTYDPADYPEAWDRALLRRGRGGRRRARLRPAPDGCGGRERQPGGDHPERVPERDGRRLRSGARAGLDGVRRHL